MATVLDSRCRTFLLHKVLQERVTLESNYPSKKSNFPLGQRETCLSRAHVQHLACFTRSSKVLLVVLLLWPFLGISQEWLSTTLDYCEKQKQSNSKYENILYFSFVPHLGNSVDYLFWTGIQKKFKEALATHFPLKYMAIFLQNFF